MIPIPNLPSDSLYKFTFIGGLLVVIVCVFLYQTDRNDEIEHEMVFATTTLREADRNRYLDTLYIRRYDRIDSMFNASTDPKEKKELEIRLMDLSDKLSQLGDAKGDFDIIEQIHKNYHSQKTESVWVLFLIGGIAFGAAAFGWFMWSKQQKVQDAFVNKQYELQETEVEMRKLELEQKIKELQTPQ